MDLQSLMFFITIGDNGSFTAASEKLHYAQSNLSNRIKELEKELDEPLFYRGKSGVILTSKGELFYQYAKDILRLSDEAKIAVSDNVSAKGKLSIGSIETFATYDLPTILNNYHSSYPNVKLSLEVGLNEIFEEKIEAYDLDGAFVADFNYNPILDSVYVKKEKMIFAVSSAKKYKTICELLTGEPIITFPSGSAFRNSLERYLDKNKITSIAPFITINSLGAMIASICAGIGCGYLPKAVMEPYKNRRMVRVFSPNVTYTDLNISFIYRKNRIKDAAFRYFISGLK